MSSSTECIQVMVRCRPINAKEQGDKRASIVSVDPSSGQISLKNSKSDDTKQFTFDAVFDGVSKQDDVFSCVAQPIIDSVMNGYNGTIFAYGQTGTGKTHTMEGQPSPELRGIIPRSFDYIFSSIQTYADRQYLVRASFLEIYNESIRDLLAASSSKNESSKGLDLRENKDRGIFVAGLKSEVVESVPAMLGLLQKGNSCRSTGATLMNQDSSRSHSIFTITVECTNVDGGDHVRVGKLNLVDLAGSERQSKTGATGDRFTEAKNINLSLSALGNVITALVDGQSGHVPYRDSKLTRLLQDSLGGNTKTVMIANVGPADWNYDETLSTLRYANRAKNIKNKPKINEDPKDTILREYQEEIARLKAALEGRPATDASFALSEEEMAQMRSEIEEQLKMSRTANCTIKLTAEQLAEIEEDARTQAEARRQELEAQAKAAAEEAARIQAEAQAQLGNLESKQAEAERLRKERTDMEKKLKLYESKILHSENNDVEAMAQKAAEREAQLKQKREELEKRRAKEAEIEKKLVQREETAMMKEKQYATLDQEVKDTKKKLKKLLHKHEEMNHEVEELYAEWEEEKDEHMQHLRVLHQQLRLKELVIDLFVPVEEVQKVTQNARWNDDTQQWGLQREPPAKKSVHTSKRPVSAQGLRRPTTDFSKTAHAVGDMNPRFHSDNILALCFDMPEKTTIPHFDATNDESVEVLNMAFADEGGRDFLDYAVSVCPVQHTQTKKAQPSSGRRSNPRPTSARKRSE